MAPMHGLEYVEDSFTSGVGNLIGFFMFVTTLTPIAKLISRMVDEKEQKVKEYMKMMGMTDTSY